MDDENDDLKRGPFVFRDIEGLSIRVRSIAESVRFYRDTLGMLTYVQDGGTMAVRAGETALHLEEAASDDITATKICLTLRYTEFEAAVKKFSEDEISYEPVRSAPELRALRLA